MADDNLVNQEITVLQQSLPTTPPANQTLGPGVIVGVPKGDPFGTFWVVKFFDQAAPQEHTLQFGGALPSNVTLGATLTLSVAPPSVTGGYSTLVSAQAAEVPAQ